MKAKRYSKVDSLIFQAKAWINTLNHSADTRSHVNYALLLRADVHEKASVRTSASIVSRSERFGNLL